MERDLALVDSEAFQTMALEMHVVSLLTLEWDLVEASL